MISELMPRGYDNMFFALFGITNRAVSSFYYTVYVLGHAIDILPLSLQLSAPTSSRLSSTTLTITGWDSPSYLPSAQPP